MQAGGRTGLGRGVSSAEVTVTGRSVATVTCRSVATVTRRSAASWLDVKSHPPGAFSLLVSLCSRYSADQGGCGDDGQLDPSMAEVLARSVRQEGKE